MKKIRKYIIWIIIIATLVYIGLFSYKRYENIVKNRFSLYVKSEKYNSELRNLRKEQDALNIELNDLYEELYTGGLGSTIFVLSDTHEGCLDDAVATLSLYGYKGVIVLSSRYLPEENHKGYLTREQIDELVEQGYEIVIKATNEDLIKTYERFAKLNYDIKGFYFEDMAVNNLMVEQIRNIDENLVVIGNYLDGISATDTLLIHYYGSRQSNVKTNYEESIDKSEVIALTVGYDKSISRYEEKNFINMLNNVRSFIWSDETEVCNITEAIERNAIYLDKLSEIKPEQYERMIEIRKRLDDISKQIMEMELQ